MSDVMKIYEDKMINIFSNNLECNGNIQESINYVKIWLRCEWQCSSISTEEYSDLKVLSERIADTIFKELCY